MTSQEVLPCPFCGRDFLEVSEVKVFCLSCGVVMNSDKGLNNAITLWNRRPDKTTNNGEFKVIPYPIFYNTTVYGYEAAIQRAEEISTHMNTTQIIVRAVELFERVPKPVFIEYTTVRKVL